MKSRQLLYLTAQQMACFEYLSGHITPSGAFTANDMGYRQFTDYLRQHPDSIYSLLLNVSEEGFHLETIPFLRGKDRQAVIKRKLNQIFFNAPLTTSISLGHEKATRKNEHLLLAALTGSENLAPWLTAIRSTEIALSSIHSLPLLVPALLQKIRIKDERCIFLSIQDQSIRQSYLENGQIHFSRLAHLSHSSIAATAQAFSSETHKLLQYLTSQRVVARDQVITAYILAHGDAAQAIRHQCIDTDTLHHCIIDINECAGMIGSGTRMATSHAEGLFLHLIATAAPSMQFADDELRHNYHLSRCRSALLAGGSIALLIGALTATSFLYTRHTVSEEISAMNTEEKIARQKYEEIARTFPSIQTDNETLRRVISRYEDLRKGNSGPVGLYVVVSRAVHQSPAVDIDAIDWTIDDTSVAGKPPPQVGESNKYVVTDTENAVIRGTLRSGITTNPRQILTTFNQFVDSLKTNQGLHVDILKRPFDTEPGKTLKNEDTNVEDRQPRSFVIRLSRKIAP